MGDHSLPESSILEACCQTDLFQARIARARGMT